MNGLNLTNPHRTPKTQDDPFPNNWIQYRFQSNGHIHHQLGNYVFWVVDDDGNMKLTVIGNADYNIGSYNESTGTYFSDSGNVNWRCSTFNVTGDITAGRVFNAVYNVFFLLSLLVVVLLFEDDFGVVFVKSF